MPITTRSKNNKLPPKRKAEDEDIGPRPRPKAPRTTAPNPLPEPTASTQAENTRSTRSMTGKLPPKRKAEDEIDPTRTKLPRGAKRNATPAPDTKPATAAKKKKTVTWMDGLTRNETAIKTDPPAFSSAQGPSKSKAKPRAASQAGPSATCNRTAKNSTTAHGSIPTKDSITVDISGNATSRTTSKARAIPKQVIASQAEPTTKSSRAATPGPSRAQNQKQETDTRTEDSGKGKSTAKENASTERREINNNQSQEQSDTREESPPLCGWQRTPSFSPNDNNEEIHKAKANSRWHEPKVVDKAKRPKPPSEKLITERAETEVRILVCGTGPHGELGLGIDGGTRAETPRLNHLLSSSHDKAVVDFACGARHTIALTRDGRILTWGCNKHGALGRETRSDPEKSDSDEVVEGPGWEPEAVDTPHLGHNVTWTQVVATDDASFALTSDGRVFGWGTFTVCGALELSTWMDV